MAFGWQANFGSNGLPPSHESCYAPNLMAPKTSSRSRYLLFAAASAIACVVSVAMIDTAVSTTVMRGDLPGDFAKGLNLAEVFAHGVGVAFICIAFAVVDSRRHLLPRLIFLPAACGVVAQTLKAVVVRNRPHSLEDGLIPRAIETFGAVPGSLDDSSLQSFPSGHTATAVGLAIALSRLYPKTWPLFVCYAALAAGQRVACGAHFLSDTFAGAAVAFLVSAFLADRLFWDADWRLLDE